MSELGDLIRQIRDVIRNTFQKIPTDIRIAASHSLEITTIIKNILNNPTLGFALTLIPGNWEKPLRDSILKAIEESLPYLMIVDECKENPTTEGMIVCWIQAVSQLKPDLQKAILQKLAALITAKLHGNKLAQDFYDTYVQLTYSHGKK